MSNAGNLNRGFGVFLVRTPYPLQNNLFERNKKMKKKQPTTLIVFYVLVLYIFLQFSWWAYLIFTLNVEILELQKEVGKLSGSENIENYNTLLRNKLLMITGEGAVFLLLLFIGFRQVRKSFIREIALGKQQNNFLLSVTHELNSPLASIKLYLQTLARRELPQTKQKEIINKALKDVERQSNLINNILSASRLEDNSYTFYPESIKLGRRIKDIVDVHPQETHKVNVEVEEEVEILADPGALDSVIINLFENALKYSEKQTEVTLRINREEDFAVFSVEDQGTGIDAGEREKIFDKFYRSGDESTRKTKGTGLGLFLVKFYVKAGGGTIEALPNQPKGTIFKVKWPLA